MKKLLCILLSAGIQQAFAQLNSQNISFSHSSLGLSTYNWSLPETQSRVSEAESQFTYKNLRIYMLRGNENIRKAAQNYGNYLNLEQALKQGKLLVEEMAGGVVNSLTFENISQDTILILAGEVVTGGKQDRVVSNDLLLPPNSGKVQAAVFCVEAGRWTPNGTGHHFRGYFGVSNSSVRKEAVVTKNQGQVWSKVAKTNEKAGTSPSSGTLAAVMSSDSVNMELEQYMAHFEPLIFSDSNYIGFVAVTGDTIISCDIFGSNEIYNSQGKQLLKSAAIEAITVGTAVVISSTKVVGFLNEFLMDESTQDDKVQANGSQLKTKSGKVHINYFPKGK